MTNAPFSVSHSGYTWGSRGLGPNGLHIWPIEEYLARTNHGPNVSERIKRLNPNGKEEGTPPRGWHPHARKGGKRASKL